MSDSNSREDQEDDDGKTITNLKTIVSRRSIVPKTQAEKNVQNSESNQFFKIVLTGGPCGGKTTSLARLSSYLRERGYEVMTCPEAFSIIATNGFSDNFNSVEGMLMQIQHSVLDLQVSIEDSFEVLLRASGKPSVLLCDRGLMDGKAYLTEEEWQTMLSQRRGLHDCDFREGRYNAIFHLVTAAEGAEAYYTLENNAVRSETAEVCTYFLILCVFLN